MSPMSSQKCLQFLTFILLFVCFCYQVKDSLIKFTEGRTTMAVGVDKELGAKGLLMPPIILCPGFRPSMEKEFVNVGFNHPSKLSYFDAFPEKIGHSVSEDDVLQWWRSITYDIDDFVEVINIQGHTKQRKHDMALQYGNLSEISDVLSIDEVWSALGRCYIIKSQEKFKFCSEYLSIRLNVSQLSGQRVPGIYVAPEGAEIGLQSNYWMGDVIYTRLEQGQWATDVALRREDTKVKKKNKWNWLKSDDEEDNDECHDYAEGWEWFGCALEWERTAYLRSNCSNVCAIPQALLVTRTISPPIGLCTNHEDWTCAVNNYIKIYPDHVNHEKTGCAMPCQYTRYTSAMRKDGATMDNRSLMFFFYQSTRVKTFEEYDLFDANSIVAAVGGSLGLFLGFSCWQVGNAVITGGAWMAAWFGGKKGEGRSIGWF